MHKDCNVPTAGTIITYLDRISKNEIDETGHNQIGVVVSNSKIITVKGRKVFWEDWSEIKNTTVNVFLSKNIEKDAVLSFFEQNKMSPQLFQLGLSVLTGKLNSSVFQKPVIMPRVAQCDCESGRSKKFLQDSRAGDLLCTFDRSSRISRLIAWIDGGLWSHVATCTGQSTVVEATTKGVVESGIDRYVSSRYRIGLYRYFDYENIDVQYLLSHSRKAIGDRYSYWGAMKCGFQQITTGKSDIPTPNGLIFSGAFYLVDYA